MKHIKTSYIIAIIAISLHPTSTIAREKRSFPWLPFFGSGDESASDVAADAESQEHIQIPSIQHLSPGYHYPVWKVHKYNGIHLKPMPISLVQQNKLQHIPSPIQLTQSQLFNLLGQQNLVQPHNQLPIYLTQSQVNRLLLQQQPQFQQSQHQFQTPSAGSAINGNQPASVMQQDTSSNDQNKQSTGSMSSSSGIPPELQELADQFGIKDASKLPSLDEAMNLLGTTSRAETIQTIKELAATPQGMDLVRQFLASDEGAAATEDVNTDDDNGETAENENHSQAITPQQQIQPQSFATQQQFLPQSFIPPQPIQPQQFIPQPQIIGNQQRLPVVFPGSHVPLYPQPHRKYDVPRPYPPQQQVYGLPNANQVAAFHQEVVPPPKQGYYAPRANTVESVNSEANIPHKEYNVPNKDSEASVETQVPHKEYGVPNEVTVDQEEDKESQKNDQHEVYGLPNAENENIFYMPPSPQETYGLPNDEENAGFSQPQQTYGVPNEALQATTEKNYELPSVEENEVSSAPEQTYGVPNEASQAINEGIYEPPSVEENEGLSQPQQTYGPPHEAVQALHETYGLPNTATSQSEGNAEPQFSIPDQTGLYSLSNEATQVINQGSYGLPNADENQGKIQPYQIYSVPEQPIEEQNEAVQNEYGPPHVDNNEEASIPTKSYGVPNQDHVSLNSGSDELNQPQDITVPQKEYSIPEGLHTDVLVKNHPTNHPQMAYQLPHQQFFQRPAKTFRQPHTQLQLPRIQYGPITKYNVQNIRTQIPLIRQIDNTLDRANTNLELSHLLTTTLRPEAGFLERIGSWTKYFVPPGPTIPIEPAPVEEHTDNRIETPDTIPLSRIPDPDEPHLDGLPTVPQLPNIHIPSKFIMPQPSNQEPFIHMLQSPSNSILLPSRFSSESNYKLPTRNHQPFNTKPAELFVPDISQLPLEKSNGFENSQHTVTSFGTPAQYTDDDSSPAASEHDEQHIAVILPNRPDKGDSGSVKTQIKEIKKTNGPQRISSYDSYATGKLNRANDDAINQLIPTQKPYYNRPRRLSQLEDSTIIDAIATMTSGFRPIN